MSHIDTYDLGCAVRERITRDVELPEGATAESVLQDGYETAVQDIWDTVEGLGLLTKKQFVEVLDQLFKEYKEPAP